MSLWSVPSLAQFRLPGLHPQPCPAGWVSRGWSRAGFAWWQRAWVATGPVSNESPEGTFASLQIHRAICISVGLFDKMHGAISVQCCLSWHIMEMFLQELTLFFFLVWFLNYWGSKIYLPPKNISSGMPLDWTEHGVVIWIVSLVSHGKQINSLLRRILFQSGEKATKLEFICY